MWRISCLRRPGTSCSCRRHVPDARALDLAGGGNNRRGATPTAGRCPISSRRSDHDAVELGVTRPAVRGERPTAFGRRCIRPAGVVSRSNSAGMLPRLALQGPVAASISTTGATRDLHFGRLDDTAAMLTSSRMPTALSAHQLRPSRKTREHADFCDDRHSRHQRDTPHRLEAFTDCAHVGRPCAQVR